MNEVTGAGTLLSQQNKMKNNPTCIRINIWRSGRAYCFDPAFFPKRQYAKHVISFFLVGARDFLLSFTAHEGSYQPSPHPSIGHQPMGSVRNFFLFIIPAEHTIKIFSSNVLKKFGFQAAFFISSAPYIAEYLYFYHTHHIHATK